MKRTLCLLIALLLLLSSAALGEDVPSPLWPVGDSAPVKLRYDRMWAYSAYGETGDPELIAAVVEAVKRIAVGESTDICVDDYTDILTFTFEDGSEYRLEFEADIWVGEGRFLVEGLEDVRRLLDGLIEDESAAPGEDDASGLPAEAPMDVGTEIAFSEITDFYYTFDASWYPPLYQRYRFYVEDGAPCFYHETREGGGWPQTEEDITASGTVALSEAEWAAFCECIRGGIASVRVEHLEDGDAGPWMYVYWTGGEPEGREFAFESYGKQIEFEEFCEGLKKGPAE